MKVVLPDSSELELPAGATGLDAALEWLRESYWLKAPAHLRKAVE